MQCKSTIPTWEGSQIQQEVFEHCNWACRTSVFKQVRNAAKDVLQEANYPYLCIYPCFDTNGATSRYKEEGFDYESISDVLSANMGDLYYQLAEKVGSWEDPASEIAAMFDAQEDSMRHVAAQAMTKPINDPVMLLYIYLAESDSPQVKDYHVQERLNAVDRFERYVGLVAIASMRKAMARLRVQVLPQFTERELISDVRDLAEVVKSNAFAVDEEYKSFTEKCWDCLTGFSTCCSSDTYEGDKRNQFVEEEFKLLKERVKRPQVPASGPTTASLKQQLSRWETKTLGAEDQTPLLGWQPARLLMPSGALQPQTGTQFVSHLPAFPTGFANNMPTV